MRITACLLIAIITLLFPSCDKDPETIELRRIETQCADPWRQQDSSGATGPDGALRAYLMQRDVTVLDVRYEVDQSVVTFCEACDCGTGRIIVVTVPETQSARMEDLGFKQ
ncbi:hypothetical protein [Lewinella sp. IMCC34191]|uniref:hypothetical protein n=1 Tax=Lewinella sp. IMCC34191 TaxID=2259172 RepID=UPI001300A36B|nr:hypothetical protein [Lewinella sp. IMCC34191]